MKVRPSDFFGRWDGTLDRGPYALAGILLFLLKHNIDRFVAIWVYDRPWSLFYYLTPTDALRFATMPAEDRQFYATLVAIALPFIYVGTLMTVKRLRSAGLPPALVLAFFIPFANLVFFALLSVLPEASEVTRDSRPTGRFKQFLDRLIPEGALGSAAVAILLILPIFVVGVLFAINGLGQYGWGIFVGLPFYLGMFSVLVYGYHEPRSLGSCIAVAMIATVVLGLSIVALAFEGIICVAMAAPIMGTLALLGAVIGYVIQKRPVAMRAAPLAMLALLVVLPGLMGAEAASATPPPLVAVRTSIDIDAPPERVWSHVVAFTELPEPTDLFFRTGVAYPMRAEISGHGVGAARRCVFSTGPFVEPIEVWDEPRLLKFSVTAQPPAMREMTPYGRIDPPHLDNYLVSEGGQFLLTPLPDGRTHLEGTTWYRNRMWPSAYWQLWSDMVIHRIHQRVLDHVKTLAEQPAAS